MGNDTPIDKDLQEIIDVVAEGVQTVTNALKDGKISIAEAFGLAPTLMKVPTAIEGNENAWAYLKDMTEEKEAAVIEAVTEKLQDYSDNVKESIRVILRALSAIYIAVKYFVTIKPV